MTTPLDALAEKIARAVWSDAFDNERDDPYQIGPRLRKVALQQARFMLAAIDSSGTHVVVPTEMTRPMWNAVYAVANGAFADGHQADEEKMWTAALSARPKVSG